MALIPNGIPEKTIERLSEYRRTLLACRRRALPTFFRFVLAGIHGITAVQVRRDLMLIGFSSDTKKGYDVKVLIDFISNILDSENPVNIAVIGMEWAGHHQIFQRSCGSRSRSTSIPQKWILRSTTFRATTWSVSRRSSRRTTSRSSSYLRRPKSPPNWSCRSSTAGIKGVLNFTSTRLNFPQGIYVENYDITTLLEKVAYCVKESEENNDNN